jgi:hypothetical protein
MSLVDKDRQSVWTQDSRGFAINTANTVKAAVAAHTELGTLLNKEKVLVEATRDAEPSYKAWSAATQAKSTAGGSK